MINERQRAFPSGDVSLWHSMKSSAKKEIATRKKDYYENKVQHLRSQDPRKWWSAMSDMSGKLRKSTYFSLQDDGKTLSQQELVNSLNYFYTTVNSDLPPLDITALPTFLPSTEAIPTIQPYQVCKKLLLVKLSKAHGHDSVPAYELTAPVATDNLQC